MQAINEVGISKVIKFALYTILLFFFDHAGVPPIRIFLLRLFGAKVGKGCVIYNVRFFNLYYAGFSNLEIGDHCFIGDEVMIDLAGKITLRNHVTLANRCILLSHMNVGYKNHPLQKYFPKFVKSVTIDQGSVVGVSAVILPGVTVGAGSMIGALSLVNRDVPQKTLVAGVPAKIIKRLTKK